MDEGSVVVTSVTDGNGVVGGASAGPARPGAHDTMSRATAASRIPARYHPLCSAEEERCRFVT